MINALMVCWLQQLAADGRFAGQADILELGPQDINASREVVETAAFRLHGETGKRFVEGIFDESGRPRKDGHKIFYAMLGLSRYCSMDIYDKRADYRQDLNSPVEGLGSFSVITNFGTAEHCFNIAAVFQNIHNLLKVGGTVLHVLPAFGDINHGFYNVHPVFYQKLAGANGYELVDFRYVDNLYIRHFELCGQPQAGFDFEALPVTQTDMQDMATLQRKVALLFARNIESIQERWQGATCDSLVFDYCFVALKKVEDRPFLWPSYY